MARYLILRIFPQEADLKDLFFSEEYRATEAYLQAIPGVSVKRTAYPLAFETCPCSKQQIHYLAFEITSTRDVHLEIHNLGNKGFWHLILEEDETVKKHNREIVEKMGGIPN